MNLERLPWYNRAMATPSKKIVNLTLFTSTDGIDPAAVQAGTDSLLLALTARFPQFTFRLDGADVFADGEAWNKKASERPAMGSMVEYAEGYVQCLRDASAKLP